MNTITPHFNQQSLCINNNKNKSVSFTSNVHSTDKIELNSPIKEKPDKMLLSLLKSAITEEKPNEKLFKTATTGDWEKLIGMTNGLSLTALVSDGVAKLPEGSVPSDTLMKILKVRDEAEKDHAKKVEILSELSEKFAAKGVETIHMKGAGFSMNYPNPNHRFGNDIDIFTRLKGHTTTTLSDSYNIADGVMIEEGLKVGAFDNKHAKHSEFNYKGVEVDNHKYFIAKKQFPYAEKLDMYLHKNINPREQLMPNGKKILVPSKEFNSVFLAHHAYQHHIIHELNLHHLLDWVVHIQKEGLQVPQEAKGTKFEEFTYALTNISNRYFGTDVKVPENREYEDKLLAEIIHPTYKKPDTSNMNNIELLIHKTRTCFNNARRIQEMGGNSLAYTFGKAVLHKLLHPTTILVR